MNSLPLRPDSAAPDKPRAGLWLGVFLAGYAALFAAWLVTLCTPVPFGDLSRIARLSEYQFGGNTEPPVVAPALLRSSSMDQADILVIGDSFSRSLRWQSALVKAGYRVNTAHWDELGGALCGDLGPRLSQAGFKGKLIVIESIERFLDERLASSEGCDRMAKAFKTPVNTHITPPERAGSSGLNWDAPFTAGLITYRNTRRARLTDKDVRFPEGTVVRPVADGCRLFSHRLCEKALFLAEDDDKGPLTRGTLARMERFNQAHPTLPVMWMVIPNKTTVYLRPEASAEFAAPFRQSGFGPDLFDFAATRHLTMRDFYLPNDTHLSMQAQLELGEVMLRAVRDRLAADGVPAP